MVQYFSNYSLLPHNTFGIAAQTSIYATYETHEDVSEILSKYAGAKFLPIGMGSNLLFLSPVLDRVVLRCQNHEATVVQSTEEEVFLRVGAGWKWDEFVSYTLHKGWYGLENLSYIPGETGASAVQNVGAFGVEAGQLITAVEAVDLRTGALRVFDQSDLAYAYRHSFFKQPNEQFAWSIISVTYRLSLHFRPNLSYRAVRDEVLHRGCDMAALTALDLREIIIAIRRSKLPEIGDLGSAGSFFKNPIISLDFFQEIKSHYPDVVSFPEDEQHVKLSAGWLIDSLGWRGKRMGNVGVYDKQALVIVNYGGASGRDVRILCEAIRRDVKEAYGIELQPEVNFIE